MTEVQVPRAISPYSCQTPLYYSCSSIFKDFCVSLLIACRYIFPLWIGYISYSFADSGLVCISRFSKETLLETTTICFDGILTQFPSTGCTLYKLYVHPDFVFNTDRANLCLLRFNYPV
jgi:hypothetical protein